MDLVVKHFKDLTIEELFEIYKLRVEVFVVEQECMYQEVDDVDKVSYHVYLKDKSGIQGYLRVIPKGQTFDEVSIGRVIAVKRRSGIGSEIVKKGIEVAKDKFEADCIVIEAQTYARKLYDNLGFIQCSEEFLDVGIPHIKMIYNYL